MNTPTLNQMQDAAAATGATGGLIALGFVLLIVGLLMGQSRREHDAAMASESLPGMLPHSAGTVGWGCMAIVAIVLFLAVFAPLSRLSDSQRYEARGPAATPTVVVNNITTQPMSRGQQAREEARRNREQHQRNRQDSGASSFPFPFQ